MELTKICSIERIECKAIDLNDMSVVQCVTVLAVPPPCLGNE